MSHAFYVYMSWGISAVVILAMIGIVLADGRRQLAELARLEKAGIRRRSAETPAEPQS